MVGGGVGGQSPQVKLVNNKLPLLRKRQAFNLKLLLKLHEIQADAATRAAEIQAQAAREAAADSRAYC
jgi:hypothetical protein